MQIGAPYEAVKAGLAFVTEDRRHTGFFHNFSIAENISVLPFLKRASQRLSLKLLDFARERALGNEDRDRLRIRCEPAADHHRTLERQPAEGHIAKWLEAASDPFSFDEPNRGIDVGAKREIYQIMRQLAHAGKGFLMVSSELPELPAVCDRIAVHRHGGTAPMLANAEASEENNVQIATA